MNTDIHAVRTHIRWMIRRDMHTLLWIEQQVALYPMDEEDFLNALGERGVFCFVCEDTTIHQDDAPLLGHMIVQGHDDCWEILQLSAIKDEGTAALLRKVKSKLTPRRPRAEWAIHEEDRWSIHAARAAGWKAVEVVRADQPDGRDSWIFQIERGEG